MLLIIKSVHATRFAISGPLPGTKIHAQFKSCVLVSDMVPKCAALIDDITKGLLCLTVIYKPKLIIFPVAYWWPNADQAGKCTVTHVTTKHSVQYAVVFERH